MFGWERLSSNFLYVEFSSFSVLSRAMDAHCSISGVENALAQSMFFSGSACALIDKVSRLGQTLWNYNVGREQLLPIFCQKLSMFVVN